MHGGADIIPCGLAEQVGIRDSMNALSVRGDRALRINTLVGVNRAGFAGG